MRDLKQLPNEQIARLAKALANPTRITILHFLSTRRSCFFSDIHHILPIAKATVSQHLSELKEAGLIQSESITPKVKYYINQDTWKEAKELFSTFFSPLTEEKATQHLF